MRKVGAFFILFTLLWLACQREKSPSASAHLTYQAQRYEGRLLNDWIALTLSSIQEQHLSPPEAARVLGYVGLTAWEAICHGVANSTSLSGQIRDYEAPAFDPNRVYDWGIVLCTAMRNVLPEVLENMPNNQRSALEVLAAAQEDTLVRRGISERVRQDSRLLGGRIAAAIAARARRDGRIGLRQITPALPPRDDGHPQYWTPSAPGQTSVEPLWRQVNTFVWEPNTTCLPPAPPPYAINSNSSWYLQAQEVANIPKTTANRLVAFHWEDGPGRSSTAAGHWFNIARQLLERGGNHLVDCAQLYCLLGLAAADAALLCWSVKYQYFLLRPITYIQENIDPNWRPSIFTPAHPEYPSEGAAIAAASAHIIIRYLGDSGLVDRTHSGSLLFTPDGGPFVLPERTFGAVRQAAEEAVFAPMLGGIHFRRSCEEGRRAGQCLADQLLQRLQFAR
ncbi:MAG: hypothetical protein RMJ33_06110 [Saprospiraceae bacterium]|nr:hypothetical protein [Saprospiraceae bacterium]MDW8229393.1 hypothetical protein [Saprospiraceae bacterium]